MNKKLALTAVSGGLALGLLIPTHPFISTHQQQLVPANWLCEGAPTQEPGTGDHDVYVDKVGHPVIDPTQTSIRQFHLVWVESCEER